MIEMLRKCLRKVIYLETRVQKTNIVATNITNFFMLEDKKL